MIKSNVLGYPRIGKKRELKKAEEQYWKGKLSVEQLAETAKNIRKENWQLQKDQRIDLIPSNDFSFYDQVLDAALTFGCIPERFKAVKESENVFDLYFAMARGIQKGALDITAMEMTKWFDTNYHFIVPEFTKNQQFEFLSRKAIDEYEEALSYGIETKPVLISPVTFLLLGKEKEEGFHRIELLDRLLPVFIELLNALTEQGARIIQVDEPCLALDLNDREKDAITKTYNQIAEACPSLKIILTNYFDCCGDNLETALNLPVHAIHLDLVRCPAQLDDVLTSQSFNKELSLSLGLVNGRNIWINDIQSSLEVVEKVSKVLPSDQIYIASSCSLLHSPYDLDLENNEENLPSEVKQWIAFAKQKLQELKTIQILSNDSVTENSEAYFVCNTRANKTRKSSTRIHNSAVKERVTQLLATDGQRLSNFKTRQDKQRGKLNLPFYPTTTIGSFPQTSEVRSWRAKFKKGELSAKEYEALLEKETEATIRFQDEIGLDVLVHGEFERNDMVEYFGEKLEGFAFSSFGWVQSYGSRCVKPPIIYGDVSRIEAMTVRWSTYAQSLTNKPVKGMLTGPVTILQWSFVRDDQERATTCKQIALAIRDEVVDLEAAGLKVIQIDEPAIREGLPLRKDDWKHYLNWAIESFRISASGVQDETQIHTHMCYSEFNDIIDSIGEMDADVITIETSRSEMELLDAFVDYKYPNEIGPGVYDIHSPRVPSKEEIEHLLMKASEVLPVNHIWVNPDCGLKTRDWPETKKALTNLVSAAKKMREKILTTVA